MENCAFHCWLSGHKVALDLMHDEHFQFQPPPIEEKLLESDSMETVIIVFIWKILPFINRGMPIFSPVKSFYYNSFCGSLNVMPSNVMHLICVWSVLFKCLFDHCIHSNPGFFQFGKNIVIFTLMIMWSDIRCWCKLQGVLSCAGQVKCG